MSNLSTSGAAYVFPGQGSQEVGMGRDLYESSRAARAVFDEADAALGFSLSRLCFHGPEDDLRQTVNAQPAIMTMSIACLRATAEMKEQAGIPLHPLFVAGHSLGEYTALVAANVLDFGDGVCLVRERGRLMQEAGLSRPGGMVAILGLDEAAVREICRESGAEVANFNSPGQIVISGSKRALGRAMRLAEKRKARKVIPLQVSGAFHSSLMQPAANGMAEAIGKLSFRRPTIPIIGNSTGGPVTTADAVKAELLSQLTSPVQWQGSVEYMASSGVKTFVEFGPGRALAGLIKRIRDGLEVLNIGHVTHLKHRGGEEKPPKPEETARSRVARLLHRRNPSPEPGAEP